MFLSRWLLSAAMIACTTSPAAAQDLSLTNSVFRSDIDLLPDTDQGFGNAVAADGDWAVVAASLHFGQAGQLYLFRFQLLPQPGWQFVKVLDRPAEPNNIFRLGDRLDLDGDWLAATAANAGTFLFHRNAGGNDNWGFVQQLAPEDTATRGDRELDHDVSISGNWLAVGAGRTNDTTVSNAEGDDIGSVLLYQLQGDQWALTQSLEVPPTDRQNRVGFGDRVDLSDGVLVVGAPRFGETPLQGSGRAYVYQLQPGSGAGPGQWSLQQTLSPTRPEPNGLFGTAVAATARFVAAGDLQGGGDDTPSVSNDGSVYLFERNLGGVDNWGLAINLIPSQPEFINLFGQSVALAGNLLWAGSQDGGYLFARTDAWREVDRNPAPTFDQPSNVREFGFSVDLAVRGGGQQVVALAGDKTAENNIDIRTGAAFFYFYDDGLFADSFE